MLAMGLLNTVHVLLRDGLVGDCDREISLPNRNSFS